MFSNIQEMIQYVNKEQVQIIDFKVTDMKGAWHRLSITSTKLSEDIMEKGIGFDGSSYGFLTIEKSDMVMIPDVHSAYLDLHNEVKTLVVIADIYKIVDGVKVRYEEDPRYVAKKAEDLILSSGVCDKILIGPEFEFYVLDHVSFEITNKHMEVSINSAQADWNHALNNGSNLGYHVRNHGGYHVDSPFDTNYEMRTEVVLDAESIGIPIKYHHGENGGPGQVEIEVNFASIRDMGDRSMKLINLLERSAVRHGKSVTFMPKPFVNECGSGLHVHMQLWKDGKNLMFDSAGYSGLSMTALYMIGGILTHAPSLTAITNPSTNSYKRLVPGFEAPVTMGYSTGNRSAVIRIPGYAIQEDEKRFEYRSPDGTSNPYLAYSAILLAALDGIKNKIDPRMKGFGPFDFNLYELSESEQKKIKSLPSSLWEACVALEKDQDYLTSTGVFTKNMLQKLIKQWKSEHSQIQKLPHPMEFQLYYHK